MAPILKLIITIATLSNVRACNIQACRNRPLLECDLILCSPTIDLSNRHLTGTIPEGKYFSACVSWLVFVSLSLLLFASVVSKVPPFFLTFRS